MLKVIVFSTLGAGSVFRFIFILLSIRPTGLCSTSCSSDAAPKENEPFDGTVGIRLLEVTVRYGFTVTYAISIYGTCSNVTQ